MKLLNIITLFTTGVLSLTFVSCATRPATQTAETDPYGIPQSSAGTQAAYPTTSSATYPTSNSTPAPTYPSTPAAPASTGGQSYTVQKGDTLWSISKRHNTTVSAIQSANGLSGSTIIAGQTIRIP